MTVDVLRIYISAQIENNTLVISIEDNGVGFSTEKIQQITDKLQREYTDIRSNECDNGLFMVNSIIKLKMRKEYGLVIDDTYKNGAKILLYLPI